MSQGLVLDIQPNTVWHVEEACRQAWPAVVEQVANGWLLRRSGGGIRRTNSANPLAGERHCNAALIDRIETFYRDFRQVPVFRLTDFTREISAELDRRGYTTQANTLTLLALLAARPPLYSEGTVVTTEPTENWFDLRDRLAKDPLIFRDMVAAIGMPKAFASLRAGGRTASIAYGVLCHGMLVVESVATHPDHRGKGLARRTVGALMNWARDAGADKACLQVVADNHPALAVYRALGFNTELYSYHYRFAPDAA
ncbi:GNAT family N-acetyltransferase [Mesorhizobium sp. NPDC059054]|uniref:GNAT family N-acetyltransferase n=1 Tax=Mesorhizobium sp. NPDC059054 TaxID=3346711 RepID=UPI003692E5F2